MNTRNTLYVAGCESITYVADVGNSVLKKTLGPRDEVTGDWRIPQIGDMHDLFSSPNIGRVIKPRTVREEWHVGSCGMELSGIRDCVEKRY
jgi:hypothetical protein